MNDSAIGDALMKVALLVISGVALWRGEQRFRREATVFQKKRPRLAMDTPVTSGTTHTRVAFIIEMSGGYLSPRNCTPTDETSTHFVSVTNLSDLPVSGVDLVGTLSYDGTDLQYRQEDLVQLVTLPIGSFSPNERVVVGLRFGPTFPATLLLRVAREKDHGSMDVEIVTPWTTNFAGSKTRFRRQPILHGLPSDGPGLVLRGDVAFERTFLDLEPRGTPRTLVLVSIVHREAERVVIFVSTGYGPSLNLYPEDVVEAFRVSGASHSTDRYCIYVTMADAVFAEHLTRFDNQGDPRISPAEPSPDAGMEADHLAQCVDALHACFDKSTQRIAQPLAIVDS